MDLPNGQPRHLGITLPIALSYPTPREIEVTDLLVQELIAQGTFENEEESKRREVVLGRLDKLVKEVVYRISREMEKLPEPDAREAGGKIFTFGSYRLGVHGAGTDIDTLCVVPRHVTRDNFFLVMHETLSKLSDVSELTSVTDAYVPVIKMKFQGIPIDLVFAKLNLPQVPDDLELRENSLLKNLDETCIRSINGSRVTDEILRLVPSIPAFRTSLRCIKLWAKRRAIYSNVMGFLGGVAWAMLVARICQLYPNAIAGAIVSKFFRIMFKWEWPQPVLLKPIEDGPLQVRVWNPKVYHGDRFHLMPIITPAYPSMCATHNVTQSTKKIIEDELKRAADIADKVIVGNGKWSDLFEKHDFFKRYRYYLQIIASSDSSDRQLKWSGMVESRIRHLISKLENVENLSLAHPFVKGFDRVHKCTTEQEADDVSHGIFSDKSGSESSQDSTETNVFRTVYVTTFYIGLLIDPREAGSTSPRQLNISWPTQEFTKLVKGWDKFDEKSMGIAIRYVKRGELPCEVFEEGEQRPTKKRSKPSSKAETNNKMSEQPSKKHRTTDNTDNIDNILTQSTADKADMHGSIMEQNRNSKIHRNPTTHGASSSPLSTRCG